MSPLKSTHIDSSSGYLAILEILELQYVRKVAQLSPKSHIILKDFIKQSCSSSDHITVITSASETIL